MNLASSLKKYPQKCLQADRRSAYYAAYSATSLEDALQYEFDNGKAILSQVYNQNQMDISQFLNLCI